MLLLFWAILAAGLILLQVAGVIAISWWIIAAIILSPLVLWAAVMAFVVMALAMSFK